MKDRYKIQEIARIQGWMKSYPWQIKEDPCLIFPSKESEMNRKFITTSANNLQWDEFILTYNNKQNS